MDSNENIAFFARSARCFFALNFQFFVNHTPRYLYDCVFPRIVFFHEYTCVSVSFPKTRTVVYKTYVYMYVYARIYIFAKLILLNK